VFIARYLLELQNKFYSMMVMFKPFYTTTAKDLPLKAVRQSNALVGR